MLKIIKSTEPILTSNLIVTLFGEPGIGKTSLGFSADKPLLLDFDSGAQRAIGRKDAVSIQNWKDIESITAEDLAEYNTVVIDTVGRLLEVLTHHVIKSNPKAGRSTGELTLQGYGALSVAYKAFLSKIKSFGKDIVLISHSKEESNGDVTFVRLDVAGSTKNEIAKCSDLLGFVFSSEKGRTLDFNPTSTHLGKNCANIPLQLVPDYATSQSFLADIISQAKTKLNSLSEEATQKLAIFNTGLALINQAVTAENFNALMTDEIISKDATLKKQLVIIAKSKGIEFDKVNKCFVEPVKEDDFEVDPAAKAAAESA